jgi:hypothetical protein
MRDPPLPLMRDPANLRRPPQYNLLVLYDARYRRLYRPSSLSLSSASLDGDDAEVRGGRRAARARRTRHAACGVRRAACGVPHAACMQHPRMRARRRAHVPPHAHAGAHAACCPCAPAVPPHPHPTLGPLQPRSRRASQGGERKGKGSHAKKRPKAERQPAATK